MLIILKRGLQFPIILIDMTRFFKFILVITAFSECKFYYSTEDHLNQLQPFYARSEWINWMNERENPDTLIAILTPISNSKYSNSILIAYYSSGEWWCAKATQFDNRLKFESIWHLQHGYGGDYLAKNLKKLVSEISVKPHEVIHDGYRMQIFCRLNGELYSSSYYQNNGGKINGSVEYGPSELFMYYSIINNHLN